jgi:hypothetical protein
MPSDRNVHLSLLELATDHEQDLPLHKLDYLLDLISIKPPSPSLRHPCLRPPIPCPLRQVLRQMLHVCDLHISHDLS